MIDKMRTWLSRAFTNDLVHGEDKAYYNNGKLEHITTYSFGMKDGIERKYTELGKLISEQLYQKDQLVSGKGRPEKNVKDSVVSSQLQHN